jgi:multidrug efflux pump
VVATTLVLVAVFVPLSFIQGDVGRLFREFGITLAAAVLFSSLVALTLTPMLCSKMLKRRSLGSGLTRRVDNLFRRFAAAYRGALDRVLNLPWASVAILLALSAAAAWMMYRLPAEYAPAEDRGAFFVLLRGPEGASFDYMDGYSRRMESILLDESARTDSVRRFLTRLPGSFGGGEVNSVRSIILLENWSERSEDDKAVAARIRARLAELPGVRSFVSTPSSLGLRSDGRPVEMIMGGPDYEQLQQWRDDLIARIEGMPELVNPDSNYQQRKPQMDISVDRDRAAALGVSLNAIGRTLETMLGSR